jgi:hypothetical protein
MPPLFVVEQGNGTTGFREVMIAQHARDPSRKLLETRSYHFTVFLGEHQEIIGFDLTDRDEDHLLKWRLGKPPIYYGVANNGRGGYHNHADVFINGRFSPLPVVAELESCRQNLRGEVRALLRAALVEAGTQTP